MTSTTATAIPARWFAGVRGTEIAGYVLLSVLCVILTAQLARELEAAHGAALSAFRATRHSDSRGTAAKVEASFREMYQGLRTIARLPGVRKLDAGTSSMPEDARISAQEIYNNLAENVSVSELYIVSASFDPDAAEPATGAPQKPLMTFDELIVGRNADQQAISKPIAAIKADEIEIYEYREMKRQIDWFKAHYPTEASAPALAYPAIVSREVVTCDNTRFSPAAPNDKDRSGVVYSVPIYGQDGALTGIVSAVILTSVVSELLPDGFHALNNEELGYVAAPRIDLWRRFASGDQPADGVDGLSHSEFIRLSFPDASSAWRMWAATPMQVFADNAEVKAARDWYHIKLAALLVCAFGLAAGLRWQAARHHAITLRSNMLEAKIAERTAALASAKQEAEQANAAKSRFLASVSHEIRTPMHAIVSAADLLAASEPGETFDTKIGVIRGASAALLDLVNQVLDLSAIEQGRMELALERFAPAMLVGEACAMLKASADLKALDLTCEIAEGTPEAVVADASRLRQVLINLIGNAIKFTDRGKVVVRVAPAENEAAACVAPRLLFEVRDTGRGIPPEQRARLFQPFEPGRRPTSSGEGVGLGLAISKQLVELMGGDIAIGEEAREGGDSGACATGTLFRFNIPFLPDGEFNAAMGATTTERRQSEVDARHLRGARVLLAEDHPELLALTVEMLQRLGCEVTVAHDGREAVELASLTRFDIVLMDSRMPELNGLAAARLIRAREAETAEAGVPIVAFTANAFASDRAACIEAGMSDFLSKPFSLVTLAETLKRNLSAR